MAPFRTLISLLFVIMKPLPPYEKGLNQEFNNLYSTLRELKNNRTKYINSEQVYKVYNQFLNDLNELSIVRKDEELKGMKVELPNVNDLIIDDIWQLISLCFITCGLTKFAPATYSSLSTVFKLLSHIKEGQLYTEEDLKPIQKRLEEIKHIIDNYKYANHADIEQDNQQNEQVLYIRKKYNKCEALLQQLFSQIDEIPNELVPIYNKLLGLRKTLITYVIDENEFNPSLIEDYHNQIKVIENQRDLLGHFANCDNNSQSILNGLLDDCNNLVKDININKGKNIEELIANLSVSDNQSQLGEFKKLYGHLVDIKLILENLLITRRSTLRETDLYNYQRDLKNIEIKRMELLTEVKDDVRNSNNFKNLQVLLLYLLRRCYSLIYKLLESSEPVSESLQPIHNQLSTVRRCLLDIKRIDGLNNLRELYPFQFKLASLDNLRNDGKFIINNQIPEGQGTLNALLAECFDIIYELKIELEAKEEEESLTNTTKELTDDEDINSDDEVELKRNRYVGFNEADYDLESNADSMNEDEDSEFEANDYY